MDVEPDPCTDTVSKGTDMCWSFGPDTVIAIGGGLVMELAKGMALSNELGELDSSGL